MRLCPGMPIYQKPLEDGTPRELIDRCVGEAVVVALVTERKHVISSFLVKARSGLGSGSGRGLMWDADPGGLDARGFLQS